MILAAENVTPLGTGRYKKGSRNTGSYPQSFVIDHNVTVVADITD